MELVYLWVEDYKNIHEQGFNFSSRFNCDYNKKTNELTIEENDDYIPDFFGKNINVTAIVGKNGSGKSSVLFQNYGSAKQEWTISFKIVFKNNILELLELFQSFLDDDGPYIKIFSINNKTQYLYKLISSYEYLDLNSKDKQSFSSGGSRKKLDDEYSIYLDGDILQHFNSEDIDNMTFDYGLFRENPNSLTKSIKTISGDGENFSYKLETTELEEKISNFIEKNKYNLSDFIDFEIEYRKGKKFLFRLSHGQRSIIIFLALLLEEIEMNKNLIIYLDEPDISLHPQWQKGLIHKLIKIVSQKESHKVHFIITTHSPFLLSDLPKQNIIFLEDGKQIDGLKEKKETFGANIHTLLSDSFFMENGLMGEFAKSKIDKAIKLLNKEHLTQDDLKYCEQIISIIGEPIVKNQLQRMLDSKRLKKVDKIDAIEKDIEALKAELLRLRND